MKIVINAGHTKFGIGTGAAGKLIESIETRKIAYEVMKQMASTSHEIIPAVFDQSENNLKDATTLANSSNADLFVSIHLNAGHGNGSEVYTWKGRQKPKALQVVRNLAALGFVNRGIKDGSSLYVIKNTKCESMLIEVCFLDNNSDVALYKIAGYEKIAKAICEAIVK